MGALMSSAVMLWRRLDTPGHDACGLERTPEGWQLRGAAVFQHEAMPACLHYRVDCDHAWHTRTGEVQGWVGERPVAVRVERRAEGVWWLNGGAVPGLADCVDLDFGFTPATNLLQLRRAGLAPGEAADLPVAWLDVPGAVLSRLEQRYQLRATTADGATYGYEAPRFDYRAELQVNAVGFALEYPGLWTAER